MVGTQWDRPLEDESPALGPSPEDTQLLGRGGQAGPRRCRHTLALFAQEMLNKAPRCPHHSLPGPG